MLRDNRLIGALLVGVCVGATSIAAGQSCDARKVLQETVEIHPGGPYYVDAGSPITLRGKGIIVGQTEDSDHLKMIGLALKAYVADHGAYPPGALLNAKGQLTVSWRVLLLPYLGEGALYERFDLTKRWNDPANLPLLKEMPAVYRKSGSASDTTETGFAGVGGVGSLFQSGSATLGGGRKLGLLSASEKIGAGRVGASIHQPWTAPGDIDIKNVAPLGSPHGFSGEGCAITPLVFLDGSVHLIPDSIEAGPLVSWSALFGPKRTCRCSPASSIDTGLHAIWDLGKDGTTNTEGWDVIFRAPHSGTYTVTLHVSDHFGSEYKNSTTVYVR